MLVQPTHSIIYNLAYIAYIVKPRSQIMKMNGSFGSMLLSSEEKRVTNMYGHSDYAKHKHEHYTNVLY